MSGDDSELRPDRVTLLDANTLVSAGRPTDPKFQKLRRARRTAETTLLLPEQIAAEIRPTSVRVSLDRAVESGWIEVVETPPISRTDATRARDIARRQIASRSPDKTEDDVETADCTLAGLAVELPVTEQPAGGLTVLTADRAAREGVESAVSALGYEATITTISLFDVIDDGDEDGLTIV
ncbi:MAG: hypothetical protein ABEI99_07715 [Halobaculum sp.]